MTLTAGYCSRCNAEQWRFAQHPTTGARILLFPRPESVYARVQTSIGIVPGVPYCPRCAPKVGDVGPTVNVPGQTTIVALDGAATRYAYWYSDKYGAWLRNWLGDELHLPPDQQDQIVAMWEHDRQAVTHG